MLFILAWATHISWLFFATLLMISSRLFDFALPYSMESNLVWNQSRGGVGVPALGIE